MKKLLGLAMVMICGVAACGGKDSASPANPAAINGDRMVKGPGDARVGDSTRCPVSGEEFVVDPGSPKVDYDGSTYYFASETNKKKFQANPEKYVPKRPSSQASPVVHRL